MRKLITIIVYIGILFSVSGCIKASDTKPPKVMNKLLFEQGYQFKLRYYVQEEQTIFLLESTTYALPSLRYYQSLDDEMIYVQLPNNKISYYAEVSNQNQNLLIGKCMIDFNTEELADRDDMECEENTINILKRQRFAYLSYFDNSEYTQEDLIAYFRWYVANNKIKAEKIYNQLDDLLESMHYQQIEDDVYLYPDRIEFGDLKGKDFTFKIKEHVFSYENDDHVIIKLNYQDKVIMMGEYELNLKKVQWSNNSSPLYTEQDAIHCYDDIINFMKQTGIADFLNFEN